MEQQGSTTINFSHICSSLNSGSFSFPISITRLPSCFSCLFIIWNKNQVNGVNSHLFEWKIGIMWLEILKRVWLGKWPSPLFVSIITPPVVSPLSKFVVETIVAQQQLFNSFWPRIPESPPRVITEILQFTANNNIASGRSTWSSLSPQKDHKTNDKLSYKH